MTCCTCVVQQDDHVVPGQAVLGLQHGSVPPGVQSVHVSVLVSVLVAAGRRKTTMTRTCFPFISFHLIALVFSLSTLCLSRLKRLQENHVGVPYQASKVVVAVWVFFPKADGVPVALLRLLELPQAVLNDAQIHPSRREVTSAAGKKQTGVGKHKNLEKFCESFGRTH